MASAAAGAEEATGPEVEAAGAEAADAGEEEEEDEEGKVDATRGDEAGKSQEDPVDRGSSNKSNVQAGADKNGKSSGNVKGRGKKWKFPNLLEELSLKLTSKGIVVPESRKMVLTRRREARNMGWLVAKQPPPDSVATVDSDKKRKKARKRLSQGVLLDLKESELFSAAFSGDCDACCDAIAAGANVNVRSNADIDGIGSNSAAIHIAAARGHEGVVAVLLGAKADPLVVSGRNESALDLAAKGGHSDVVRVLCSAGAAPPDAEAAMRVMRQAPQWMPQQSRTRRELRKAMAPEVPMRRSLPFDAHQSRGPPRGVWAEPDELGTEAPEAGEASTLAVKMDDDQTEDGKDNERSYTRTRTRRGKDGKKGQKGGRGKGGAPRKGGKAGCGKGGKNKSRKGNDGDTAAGAAGGRTPTL